MIKRKCILCGKVFEIFPSRLKFGVAKYCSRKCSGIAFGKKQLGELNHKWLGDNVGIDGIHEWLRIHYGKADRCENLMCEEISPTRYEWAKLKNKNYARRRYNFWRLCATCHKKYDELYKNIPSNLGRKYSKEHRNNISKALIGRVVSDETKKKISLSHMGKTPWNKKIC